MPKGKRNTKPVDDTSRFWMSVLRYGIDECWLWDGYINSDGYGRVRWCGKLWMAHRLMYFLWFGKLSRSLTVDHTCRRRRCVNPKHLEVVAQSENARRGNTGPNRRRMTPEILEQIQSMNADKLTQKEIGMRLGFSQSAISLALSR